MKDWLPDQLLTAHNLIELAYLALSQNRRELLPTVLELLFEQTQVMVDENCVLKE